MESEYLNILRLFHADSVDYVAVEDYAVIAHGFSRTIGDIVVQPTVDNAARVVRALVSYGFVNQ